MDRRNFLAASGLAAATGSTATTRVSADEQKPRPGRTPHTRFAVNVEMWWRKLPFLERVRRAAALGFPAIEFWPWKDKDIKTLAALCRDSRLAVAQFTAWGFRPGLNNPVNHGAFVQAVRDGCGVAKQLDCKLMTVVGGDDQPGMSQRQMHAHIVSGLKLAAPIAEDHDVTLILEPMNIRVDHKGHCLYGSDAALAICRQVDSTHVKINWDLYHMQITEGDLCGHLREGFSQKQIGYLQLADHPGRHEPGTGEVNYTRVLQEVARQGYRGFVGLECVPQQDERQAAQRIAAADTW
jgi:hydroxypyruvate isomerase